MSDPRDQADVFDEDVVEPAGDRFGASLPADRPEPRGVDAVGTTPVDGRRAAASDHVMRVVVVDVGPGRPVTDPARQDVGIVTSRAQLDVIADRDGDDTAGRADVVVEQEATLLDGTPVTVNGLAPLAIGDEGVAFLVEGGSESQPYHALVGSQGWIPVVGGRLTPPGAVRRRRLDVAAARRSALGAPTSIVRAPPERRRRSALPSIVGQDAGIEPHRSHDRFPAEDADTAIRPLPNGLAIALVTGTSGAVLVLEILAGRLLAPYVGVNLETYTAIIGTILAGIALGAWGGGIAADRVDPRGLIPLLLVAGGALAIASIPIVRALGGDAGPDGAGAPSVLLALWGFGPSAAVLSAVPPAVVKLQLRSLERTGTTVGHLSAWGTGGAIGGTFLAGYVLVAYAAVTTLIVIVGVLLAVAGVLLWLVNRTAPAGMMLSAGGVAALAFVGVAATEHPCDVQSSYYCISIEVDPDDAGGRVLVLDDLRHSYVDLDDPAHLEFWYIRRIADAIEAYAPAGPIDAVALGAGALTIPRWIRATRPGSEQVVLELDGDLVELIDEELPPSGDGSFAAAPDVEVIVGDGRRTMRGLPTDSADVIVGDAFGSRAVPWHLATREFMDDIARVLRPGGIYVANIIDGANESFLRAEAATMREVMPHVAVIRGQGVVDGFIGNSVVVASTAPFDPNRWNALRLAAGDDGELVDDIDDYLDGALILTDDFAPVDQLIAGVG